jgi:mannose-6-phosphate isomerase-like protein (cupin superfamily)
MSGSRFVAMSAARRDAGESIIHLRALGMSVRVRVPGSSQGRSPAVFETTNAARSGSPRIRRAEDEIVHILSGRFVFEVDGHRFLARKGDLVHVPGGASRACVNMHRRRRLLPGTGSGDRSGGRR